MRSEEVLRKNEPTHCFRIESIEYKKNSVGPYYLTIQTVEHFVKTRKSYGYTIYQTLEEFAQSMASLYFG